MGVLAKRLLKVHKKVKNARKSKSKGWDREKKSEGCDLDRVKVVAKNIDQSQKVLRS